MSWMQKLPSWVPPLFFAVLPGVMFHAAIGPFRAPGLEGEHLYGQLYSAAILERWWLFEAAPGTADTLLGQLQPYWPEAPLPALLQALLPLDPAFSLGIVVTLAVWLAGFGPYLLTRKHTEQELAALFAGLAVQLSPMVLRAVPSTDLAALGVGALALAFARPRWALLAGLWCWPSAVVLLVAGLLKRKPAWLIAGIPACAVLIAPSPLPGALRGLPQPGISSPAYLSAAGALFPMPPPETVGLREAARKDGLWVMEGIGGASGIPQPGPAGQPMPGSAVPGTVPTGQPMPGSVVPGTVPTGQPMPGSAVLPPAGSPETPAPNPADPLSSQTISPQSIPSSSIPSQNIPSQSIPPKDAAAPAGGSTTGVPTGPGASGDLPEPEKRPWIGAIFVPMQRLHGGPVLLIGLLAALSQPKSRRWGIVGLTALLTITLIYGWQLFPDEDIVAPRTVVGLRMLLDGDTIRTLPGRDHGEGSLAWAGLIGACGAMGLGVLFSGRGRWAVPLVFLGAVLENPRLVAPVTSVLPDPMIGLLSGLPSGGLLVYPAANWPYLQGPRSQARLLWEAAQTGKPVDAGWPTPDPAAAAVVRTLTKVVGLPLDVQAAEMLWPARSNDQPFAGALKSGYNYLLLDLSAIPQPFRPQLDGWMAATVGMPLAREGDRLLYDLQSGPAGIMPANRPP